MTCELLTICDFAFLPQALLLHRSLEAHAPGTPLRVLATDERARAWLAAEAPPGLTVVDVRELEALDPELAAVRPLRNRSEYCWTLTPAFCLQALEAAPPDSTVIWVDADIRFHADPGLLASALGDGSLLLVPHRFWRPYPMSPPPEYMARRYGSFNGGTVAARNDAVGRDAIRRWRERTVEWCYDRVEPGRFGNQLYLEELVHVPGVRTASSAAIGLAPWNAGRHRIAGTAAAPTVDGERIIFYHYQSLRLRRRRGPLPRAAYPANYLLMPSSTIAARTRAWLRLTDDQRELLWQPYLDDVVREAARIPGYRIPAVTTKELREDLAIRSQLMLGTLRSAARRERRRAASIRSRG